MKRKTTIWYEFTDRDDVKALRDAADTLEKNGYVKLLLPNVEIDEPDPSPTFATGGSAGGSGVGAWSANGFIYTSVGFGGGGHDYTLQRAKELGKPVLFGGGGGGGAGQQSFSIWMFPDGHTETLEVGETPRWPKDNPVRDAVMNNLD